LTKTGDTERRLVAIFAADVEGYSRLMGADEVGTTHRGLGGKEPTSTNILIG
jgi:adenylate cyclase